MISHKKDEFMLPEHEPAIYEAEHAAHEAKPTMYEWFHTLYKREPSTDIMGNKQNG